ncbi:MAG: hypothetical protein AB7E47_03150 [Desulfovibrionaceae bacterium]
MNALEQFRVDRRLSFNKLGEMVGKNRGHVWRHCKDAQGIDAASAIHYERTIGIPRAALRPDLFGQTSYT